MVRHEGHLSKMLTCGSSRHYDDLAQRKRVYSRMTSDLPCVQGPAGCECLDYGSYLNLENLLLQMFDVREGQQMNERAVPWYGGRWIETPGIVGRS